MDLRLTNEQEQLVETLGSLYSKHASPDRVRAAEPLGHDADLWGRLVDMGLVAMAVAEADGGWGASAEDLTLAAEQHGRAVAPAPLIEAQVAARLLARLGAPELAPVLSGQRLATVALQPAAGNQVLAIPAGAVADQALVLDDDRVVLAELEGARAPFANLAAMPLADLDLAAAAVRVLASGPEAVAAFEAAIDDWLRLTAAALVGIGARALDIGTAYVLERQAWGRPIGSFQSVAHRLADAAAAVDGARLLAYEAAWAEVTDDRRAAELAALAFAFAADAARDATDRSLHYHGGYGFMLEYDVQLYWRRARGWPGVWGGPRLGYLRAADRRYADQRAADQREGKVD